MFLHTPVSSTMFTGFEKHFYYTKEIPFMEREIKYYLFQKWRFVLILSPEM